MTSLLLLLASAAAPAPGADDAADAARIARLVRQLGSDDFDEREAATKELEAIGEPALAPLRKAAAEGDAEVRARAAALLRKIPGGGFTELRRLEGHKGTGT